MQIDFKKNYFYETYIECWQGGVAKKFAIEFCVGGSAI